MFPLEMLHPLMFIFPRLQSSIYLSQRFFHLYHRLPAPQLALSFVILAQVAKARQHWAIGLGLNRKGQTFIESFALEAGTLQWALSETNSLSITCNSAPQRRKQSRIGCRSRERTLCSLLQARLYCISMTITLGTPLWRSHSVP